MKRTHRNTADRAITSRLTAQVRLPQLRALSWS
jgi:hypothetical protein